uniref:Uncharacterized protein n=1 Tax=Cannabis sativa TaxID=3483 RepID=A0A803PMG1_CANSA
MIKANSQSQWKHFTNQKLNIREKKLYFKELLIRDGVKIAQVDVEEIKLQVECWDSAIICMVLGANPPIAIFEGFIRRIWGNPSVAEIARMNGDTRLSSLMMFLQGIMFWSME